jgi:hypothetical protein
LARVSVHRSSSLGITSVYLEGIDNAEISQTIHARRAPMIPVSTSPRAWAASLAKLAPGDSAGRVLTSRFNVRQGRDEPEVAAIGRYAVRR